MCGTTFHSVIVGNPFVLLNCIPLLFTFFCNPKCIHKLDCKRRGKIMI
jgi:hypothetical protein